jgi:hypothetical protein
LHYRYRFDGRVALPPGVPPSFNRQGFRVGLMTWVPMIR